jgi:hypothetical protein
MVMDYDDTAMDDNSIVDLSGFNKCAGTANTNVAV